MQVGDLVELSSAGRKSQQNWAVKDRFGMLIEINLREAYPYKVEWYGAPCRTTFGRQTGLRNGTLPCKRYELKKWRTKK